MAANCAFETGYSAVLLLELLYLLGHLTTLVIGLYFCLTIDVWYEQVPAKFSFALPVMDRMIGVAQLCG